MSEIVAKKMVIDGVEINFDKRHEWTGEVRLSDGGTKKVGLKFKFGEDGGRLCQTREVHSKSGQLIEDASILFFPKTLKMTDVSTMNSSKAKRIVEEEGEYVAGLREFFKHPTARNWMNKKMKEQELHGSAMK